MRQCKVMVHEKEAGILLATAQFDTIGAVTVKPIE